MNETDERVTQQTLPVTEEKIYSSEWHDDETLNKVRLALCNSGLTLAEASRAIRVMQNSGILFREIREKEDAQPKG